MHLADLQGLHKSGNIVGEKLGGIDAFGFVCFASPSEVERDAGKMLGVLRHLEGVAGIISGQKRNENEGLSGSLLVIVHRDVVGFDLRHKSQSFRMCSVLPLRPTGAKSYVSRTGKSMKAVELVESSGGCCRNIAIMLIE